MEPNNEIILYQPDSTVSLEVRVEDETVWLTQQQIADLFGTKRPAITKHLSNIFQSEELKENSVCSILERTAADGKSYKTKFYNLDAILSIGYRVNSRNATLFRKWANKVLKDYMIRGYSINQRLIDMENRFDNKIHLHERKLEALTEKVDFVISSSLKPKEGIFFGGEIFDAYEWLNNRIQEAKHRIIIIDPYADFNVLSQLKRRKPGVETRVYTSRNNTMINHDVKKFNKQYPEIILKKNYTGHDRFLIVDDTIYHVGGSMKDLGNRLMAYSILTVLSPEELINRIEIIKK